MFFDRVENRRVNSYGSICLHYYFLSMKSKKFKEARQPEIIRTTQKDLQYTTEISQKLTEIVQFLASNRNLIKFNEIGKTAATIFYHGFSAINRLQTLGEEYTGIIQIDRNSNNLPAKFLQVISVILEFGGESLLMKLLKVYEKKVDQSEELTSEARGMLLKLIRFVRESFPYIKAIHRGMFYLNSGHYQLSKRVTGINYALVRFWLSENQSVQGYKLLGIVTLLQVTFSLITKSKECLEKRKLESTSKSAIIKSSLKSRRDSQPSKRCILCLETRIDITSTSCGHLFCWKCICDWLQFKSECPVCREHMSSSSVIFLQNYY